MSEEKKTPLCPDCHTPMIEYFNQAYGRYYQCPKCFWEDTADRRRKIYNADTLSYREG